MTAAQAPEGGISAEQPQGGTRERLAAVASGLLAEGGESAVTLRAVGERAGVSRTAPYRHFRDKDDLLSAVRLEAFGRLFQGMAAEMAAVPAVPEALRRGFRAYIRFGAQWPEHYLLVFGERITSADKADLAKFAPEGIAFFRDFLARGQRAGEIRSGDVHDMTILAWSALHGLVTFALTGHLSAKGLDTEEALDRLIAELVAGLEA